MKIKRIIKNNEAMLFNMLIGAGLAIVMLFAILNVGTFINGTISDELINTYPAAASRTEIQTKSVNTMTNLTDSYDDTTEIVVVAAIVMAITMPLAAVVAIKNLF